MVTLLLRAGTDVTTLDNSGRTPIHLAQSKLRILQQHSSKNVTEMTKVSPFSQKKNREIVLTIFFLVLQVKEEVSQVVDMMREYLSKTGVIKDHSAYSDLLNSFSQRLTLHNNHDEIHNDLANLLDTLGNLHLDKT